MRLSNEQQSVLAIAAGLVVLALAGHHYYLLLAASLLPVTLPFPALTRPIHYLWSKLAEGLGWVSSHVILFVLFYLVLTPIATVRRLLGQDPIRIKGPGAGSGYHTRNHLYRPADLESPW
ncbi:MAG TPA: SxtJ family membrane protein [Chitinophagaceae bacterium]|nr:SxtJ family membrane protein [Chitinophagaceae bacterium]